MLIRCMPGMEHWREMIVEGVASNVCHGRAVIRSVHALHIKPNMLIVLHSIHTVLMCEQKARYVLMDNQDS